MFKSILLIVFLSFVYCYSSTPPDTCKAFFNFGPEGGYYNRDSSMYDVFCNPYCMK